MIFLLIFNVFFQLQTMGIHGALGRDLRSEHFGTFWRIHLPVLSTRFHLQTIRDVAAHVGMRTARRALRRPLLSGRNIFINISLNKLISFIIIPKNVIVFSKVPWGKVEISQKNYQKLGEVTPKFRKTVNCFTEFILVVLNGVIFRQFPTQF